MTGKIPRKARSKFTYIIYIKKAEQFFKSMESSLAKNQYDSAALEGIHCVISALDALLIQKSGIVSASSRHEDAVKLLTEIWNTEDVKEASKHAASVINMKTAVEYTDLQVNQKQAVELQKHTQRFLTWAKNKLP